MVYNVFITDTEERFAPPEGNVLKVGFVEGLEGTPTENGTVFLTIGKVTEDNGPEGEGFGFQANGQGAMIGIDVEELLRALDAVEAISDVVPGD